jgi:hypothetical protein
VVLIMTPDPVLAIFGFLLGADRIAYVAGVLGELIAALAVGAEVREVRFGTARPAIRFRVRNVQVSLGLPVGYWINHRPVSAGRHAVILLGGPLANLALAGIVQAFPLPRPIGSSLAVMFVAHAVQELIPVRMRGGRASAGEQLLHLRSHGLLMELDDFWVNRDSRAHSPGLTDRVLAAYRQGVPEARINPHLLAMLLRREDRIAELLELHAGLAEPDKALDEAYGGAFVECEWNVLTVPGLPVAEADLAAARLERLPRFSRPDRQVWMAATLALTRLRQGRFAEVGPLCADALAGEPDQDKRAQARVLATVVLARRALGQPHAELIAEAESLAPDDDLVAEAAATRLTAG